jgi:hypothetical protein
MEGKGRKMRGNSIIKSNSSPPGKRKSGENRCRKLEIEKKRKQNSKTLAARLLESF